MKFDKDERFAELFKFDGSQLNELTADALRRSAIPVNWAHNYIDLPVRDKVTEIEFDELGFKGLNNKPLSQLKYAENASPNSPADMDKVIRNNFLGIVLLKSDMVNGKVVRFVCPNYLANIKNGQVYNIFDSIERLKFYNFLTDIANKDQNNWKIVTAMDRVVELYDDKFNELYPWKEAASGVTTESKATTVTSTLQGNEDLPVQEVYEIIAKNNLSLLKSNKTIMSLAKELKEGKATEQSIINELR